ncbi:endopeptidase La [Bulleidia sp. zg-1006]|uniref:endopeptidase La n=1 Tax=Bulleidia sp. zg-1006 TaxID=2806552 RepID=UPI00193A5E5E|nr:endopeptidase La [Bulleidia sp. zg-1006]QRG86180.1 endopeptidase La [Bulleidia sp. zg-1006]
MAEIVPIYNVVILPHSTVFLTSESFKEATGKEAKVGEKIYFALEKKALNEENFLPENFYSLGVSGTITEVHNDGFLIVKTHNRIEFEDLYLNANRTLGVTSVINNPEKEDVEEENYQSRIQGLKNSLIQFTSQYRWALGAKSYIQQMTTAEEIMTGMSQLISISAEDKYALLVEDSQEKRLSMIEKYVLEYTEMSNVSKAASSAQEEDNQKAYREMAIKKQIEFLQKELDEMHPENVSDIRKLEKRIQESGMNETALKEAEKILSRMKQEGSNSPEYGNLYNYLDFLTSLSWQVPLAEKIDIHKAEEILDENHYGLRKVKKRILEQIAVMDLNHQQTGSILLFVGAPGTGKTSVGKSIARALKREYVRVALGGVRDSSDIRGHRRTYIGAMPGRIMNGIQKSGSSNPVMVLDEIDKLSASYNGDPASALLEVLDPEQNNTFTDHYMNVPYDLSNVLFICTANSLDSIPEPLLNRMEVIEFQGYTESEKFQIAKRHLLPKSMAKMGISKSMLTVSDDSIRAIISGYTMEGGVRGLKKRMDQICRYTAVLVSRGRASKFRVSRKNLSEVLDMDPIEHAKIQRNAKAGIVTGLAWTAAGGEILFIESLMSEGKGNIKMTGQLGSVMQESVQIALSLVKTIFPKEAKQLENHDIHIHFPSGAVKKDGPSAGITITTALASLLTNQKVHPSLAMTGEVSLRGGVLAIGGLPEKLMAALRSGVKTVLIPKDNEKNLKDVPQEVKDQLKIVPVATIEEVLSIAGIKKQNSVIR